MGRYGRIRSHGDPGRVLRSRDGVYGWDGVHDLDSCSKYVQNYKSGDTKKEVLYKSPKGSFRCDIALAIYDISLPIPANYDDALMAKAMLMTQCRKKYIKLMNQIENLNLDVPPQWLRSPLSKENCVEVNTLHRQCKRLTEFYLKVVFDTYKNEFCNNSEAVNYFKRWVDICPKMYHKHMKEVDNFHSKFSKFST